MDTISVVIVGRDRTLMTIECIKNIIQHLKDVKVNIIVGSDRSSNGHVQAIKYFLSTLDITYRTKLLECETLGGMMNTCCDEAFKMSEFVLCIENDMILHRDMHAYQFIDVLRSTNVGNMQFRYFSPEANKCDINIFKFNGNNYMCTFPQNGIDQTCPVSFGQNLFKREFYESIGKFLENEQDTDKVEKKFVIDYCNQLKSCHPLMNALCLNDAHTMMNDDKGYFYHIGINCQHRAGVIWNKSIIPCQYHYLSDEVVDSSFRKCFLNN